MDIAKSIFYFMLAGLFEIGGGYLIWLWVREGKSIGYAVCGAVILVLYGIIPTLQPANFGRVHAAYGGVPDQRQCDIMRNLHLRWPLRMLAAELALGRGLRLSDMFIQVNQSSELIGTNLNGNFLCFLNI